MSRRPLSSVEEEPHYLDADEACAAICKPLSRAILARFAAHGAGMNRTYLGLSVVYSERYDPRTKIIPALQRMAFNPRVNAQSWSEALVPEDRDTQKAGPRRGTTEAELIDAAIDAGIELGLKTLPAKARREVDVAAARKIARRNLMRGTFRQNLAALEEAQRGLAVLVGASGNPALTVLKDVERIAGSFGLNGRQAQAIVRETLALINAGKRTDAIKRAMKARIKQALQARADILAETLGREAINAAQAALHEQALKQGLLSEDKQVQEFVTRRDERVCAVCDGMDGQRVPIGEDFVSDYDGEEYRRPPVHPRCRCAIRLVTVRTPVRGKRAA